jgi:hypothetical protein
MVSVLYRIVVSGQGGTVGYAELLQADHMHHIRAITVRFVEYVIDCLLSFSPQHDESCESCIDGDILTRLSECTMII